MYAALRKILFWFPPEAVHYFSMNVFQTVVRIPGVARLLQSRYTHDPRLRRNAFGITFANPIGLGAGFDKNARYLRALETLGFGSVEVGTVTPVAQAGNEKPRLFRIPRHRALINRMGFNNDGVHAVARRLRQYRAGKTRMIIGGNIGKNKHTPNEEAWKDYETCFRELSDCVDYFVVNVSSPNTPGLRELQEKDSLEKILTRLQALNGQQPTARPILLKIAPDLSQDQLDDVIELAVRIGLDGLVAANTTISRDALTSLSPHDIAAIGAGGLSGAPLTERSTAIVQYIHEKTGGRLPVIASGGVFKAADATAKLNAGATLVQVWTGFIYEGPAIVRRLCKGLLF